MTEPRTAGAPTSMAVLQEVLPRLSHPDGAPVHALVADPEPMIAELMAMGLSLCGWEVSSAQDGESAVERARERKPDVVVLDTRLPDMTGAELLEKLRAFWPEVPVLFLSAQGAERDRVAGLAAGADDYVTKPFSMEELVLRLHRLVQRSGLSAEAEETIVVGDLVMNTRTHEVSRGGELIELTATQFNLLKYLMLNVRTVLSKTQILDQVWGYDFGGRVNIVELYISYLRKKIDAGREPMIHTVRGAGYVLRPA